VDICSLTLGSGLYQEHYLVVVNQYSFGKILKQKKFSNYRLISDTLVVCWLQIKAEKKTSMSALTSTNL